MEYEEGRLKITIFDDTVWDNVQIPLGVPHSVTYISGNYEDWIDVLTPERVRARKVNQND